MKLRYIFNDIKQHKIESLATTFFLAISALVFGITIFLFTNLLGSIDNLMNYAKTPDFLQMHSGDIDENEVSSFATAREDVDSYQVSSFLNLENGILSLNGKSLSDSTQDNGLTVQNDYFDYLLNMNNEIASPNPGEVYVPVCYKQMYDLSMGNKMFIGDKELTIVGFIRDSQMNSMMASSKRFLVNIEDYENMKPLGSEEYLIEFKLKEGADISSFEQSYINEKLPANGPTITYSLIKLMNALSDGIMIMVILIVSVVVLLIALLCIRFLLITNLEKSKKEIGLLKAVGISKKDIQALLLGKYALLSIIGAIIGYVGSILISNSLTKDMEELYGQCENLSKVSIMTLVSVILVETIVLDSVRRVIKKTNKLTTLQALHGESKNNKSTKQYVLISVVIAACVFIMIMPNNISSTISAPDFVTYMGIGDAKLRLDLRQTDNIIQKSEQIEYLLTKDSRVQDFVSLKTQSVLTETPQAGKQQINVEVGEHLIFPVRYALGEAPSKDFEIALSVLNAKDLGVTVGDTITVIADDTAQYTVCGIYSDITNGGKTAKAYRIHDSNDEVLWSIYYVSLVEGISYQEWASEYENRCSQISAQGVKVVEIEEYLQGTYGQTISQIANASKMAKLISVSIIMVVVTLFLRMMIEQQRKDISLKKAFGLRNKIIIIEFLKGSAICFMFGIILGLLLGNFFGELIVGMILRTFGAVGFRFVIDLLGVYVVIPALTIVTLTIAAFIGCYKMKDIKAYECCISRE